MGTESPADANPRELLRKLVDLLGRTEPDADCTGALFSTDLGDHHYVVYRYEAGTESSPSLSPREAEIARLIGKGYPNKTIARALDISCWTVSAHLRRIYSKLGVSTRAEMVARLSGFPQPGPVDAPASVVHVLPEDPE